MASTESSLGNMHMKHTSAWNITISKCVTN